MNALPREALARRSSACKLCPNRIHRGDSIRQTRVGWSHSACAANYEALLRENAEAAR